MSNDGRGGARFLSSFTFIYHAIRHAHLLIYVLYAILDTLIFFSSTGTARRRNGAMDTVFAFASANLFLLWFGFMAIMDMIYGLSNLFLCLSMYYVFGNSMIV